MPRQIGTDLYTCVCPPGYEKDPAVTRAVREFDPGIIPIWRVQRWEGLPGFSGEVSLVHHGIGRYYPFPRQIRKPFYVAMPAAADHPTPNFLDAVFEDTDTVPYFRGGPGEFVPWDWRVYYWCRRSFTRITIAAYMKRTEKHRARLEAMRKAHFEEIEYKKKQLEPYLMRQAARIAPSEWEQLRKAQHENTIRRRMGLEPIALKDPKPTILVGKASGRSPRPSGETYGRVAPSQE